MATKSAPATAATQDQDLPQTAVKLRGHARALMDMQDKVDKLTQPIEIAEPVEPSPPSEEETFKKRYGDLRRHTQSIENKYKSEVSDLQKQVVQLTSAVNQPMPKTKDEFEAWKNKYPDIVPFIEMVADEKASARAAQLQEELGSVKEKLSKTEEEKSLATLDALVPNWRATIQTKEYTNWLSNQPLFIQNVLDKSNMPEEIAYYLNLFKSTLPQARGKTDNSGKLDALATSVKNTGSSPSNSKSWKFLASQIAKMTTEEYTKNEDAIMQARSEGLIFDDTKKYNSVFDI